MKRSLLLLLFTLLTLSYQLNISAKDKIVLNVHNFLNDPAFTKALDNVQKMDKYKDVEFVIMEKDELYETTMPIKISAGEQIDIIAAFDPILMARWSDRGLMIPLSEYVEEAGINVEKEFGPYAKFCYNNGEMTAIPRHLTKWVLFYNKKIFDDAGIPYPDPDKPMTWDDYRKLAAKLTSGSGAKKVYGAFHMFWPMYWYGEAIMALGGGEQFYTKDGKSNIEDPAFRKAIKATYDMMHKDKSIPTYAELRSTLPTPQAFFNGKYGMFMQGPWFLNWAIDRKTYPRDWEIGIAPMPVDSGDKFKTWGVCATLGITPTTADPELAFNVLMDIVRENAKYASTEPMALQVDQPNLFKEPGKKLAAEGMSTDILNKYFFAEDEIFVTEKITGPACAEYEQICQEEVEKYFVDEQNLDETIDNIKSRVDLYLANYE